MRNRALLVLVALLLSHSLWCQAHGGGGGHSSGPAPSTGSVSSPNRAPGPMSGLNTSTPLISANDEGKIEFRTQSTLVQVPVIVTDKSGNHVHGLTKSDLHIFENGKEQAISVLEEKVAINSKIAASALQPGEFQNLTIPEDQPRTITVIALDTVNTPFLDQTYGRRELVKYLANSLDSGQVLALMIITSHGLKVIQGLTGDPEQLVQILKKVGGELPAMQSIDMDVQADVAAGDAPDMPTPVSPGTSRPRPWKHLSSMATQSSRSSSSRTPSRLRSMDSWELPGRSPDCPGASR